MKTAQFVTLVGSCISISGMVGANPAPTVQIQIISNIPVACMVQLVAPQYSAETQELQQQNQEPANGVEVRDTEHLRIQSLSRAFLEQSYREAILNSQNYAPFMRTRKKEDAYAIVSDGVQKRLVRLSRPEIPDDDK